MKNRRSIFLTTALAAAVLVGVLGMSGAANAADGIPALEDANVVWDTPSADSMGSMPLGNGDIALNVWVEAATGDLLFYIAKTDSWGDEIRGNSGLPKVGRVRVKMESGYKAGAPLQFKQSLRMEKGLIEISVNGNEYVVWVDANRPVIHVEAKSPKAVPLTVANEQYRTKPGDGLGVDNVFADEKDRVAWCYQNKGREAALRGITFGAVIEGPNLKTADQTTLKAEAATSHRIDIHVMTATVPAPKDWRAKIDEVIKKTSATEIETARKEHLEWWKNFWDRSRIYVGGNDKATKAFAGYAQQRFMQACMGRGAYPIKFNGGLFTCEMNFRRDNKDKHYSADQRDWGGQYWFQNTRPMYWPMLASGDYDMMLPLFSMYKNATLNNERLVKQYYGHEGSYFAETAPFWGGLKNIKPTDKGEWTDRYYTPVLELTMMMLDYAEHTGDKAFIKETIVPVAKLGLAFYDKHFPRDAKGKLLLEPDNSIEQYWDIRNPTPDIVGLRVILARMMALPEEFVDAGTRKEWERLLKEVPEIPIGTRAGKKAILPMEEGQETAKPRNSENPELYAIYPFRNYGLTKPELEMAKHTFSIRKFKNKGCWVQDPIQAAMLGLADEAATFTVFALTRKDPNLRFPAFWDHGNDYMPDMDNGGNGLGGLQQMLMYTDGKQIVLLPAWPKEWNASFKLHAPFQTTVEGVVKNGKVEGLKVTPAERAKDVKIFGE